MVVSEVMAKYQSPGTNHFGTHDDTDRKPMYSPPGHWELTKRGCAMLLHMQGFFVHDLHNSSYYLSPTSWMMFYDAILQV